MLPWLGVVSYPLLTFPFVTTLKEIIDALTRYKENRLPEALNLVSSCHSRIKKKE